MEYLCDRKKCGKVIKTSKGIHKITFENHEYNLCIKCYNIISKLVDSELNSEKEISSLDKINQYGIDKIKEEYINNKNTIANIAKDIGINKSLLTKFMQDNDIRRSSKTKSTNREPKEKESHTYGVG